MSLLEVAPAPRRSSRLLIGLTAAAVLAVAATFGARRFFAPPPFSPLDSPEGVALGRAVPAFLVEEQHSLHRGGSAVAQKQRIPAVLEPMARQALGPEVATHLETLLATAVDLEVAGAPPKDLADRFARDAVTLDQAMAARGLPYFIDASIVRSSRATIPVLYSYYIERENTLSGSGKQIRSLFVRRLDDLNFASAAVGYTRPSSAAALVLLDHLESQLIGFVLPAMSAGDDTLLIDAESEDPKSEWQRELRARSAAIVKDAYGKLPAADAALLGEIGRLLNRRRVLVRSWMKAVDRQHYRLVMPRRLVPEGDYATLLKGRVPVAELGEWIWIHDRLMDAPVLAAFEAIRDQQARSVEQHEAQHQLDYERERIVLPKPVAEILGIGRADDVYDDEHASYVVGEVSAYLAELVRGPDSPALLLMVLSQSAFDRGGWGGAYCYAALAVMDGVGKELGIGGEPLIARGQVDRAALQKRLTAISDKPEQEIRQAARRVWEAWYEAKLPEVTLDKTTAHPAWRH